jgi:poly(A) polymerase
MRIARELIDADAEKVVRRLARHGYQAYLVGGCVRDLLLDRTPKDFDVATSATPKETKQLFRNCRIIGRRFRLCHIFFGPKIIETSTFRANPRRDETGDSDELLIRHDNVFGTDTEDAQRRDFTINGLFYDVEDERVIDHVGGLDDLDTRVVRTIGDPDIRFREDPVRMLRAIKFAARLDFAIEPATYRAICRHRSEITKCAPPRVVEELYRLLRGGAARRSMELLLETGIAATLSPALAAMLGDERHASSGHDPRELAADIDAPELDPEEASWHATWAEEDEGWQNGLAAQPEGRPLDLSFIEEPDELRDRQHQLWKVLDELDVLFASGY